MKDSTFEELKDSIEARIAQNQDSFTKTELLGRGLFKSFLKEKGFTDYKFTEGKFDKVDCFINAERKWEVEIKVRADSAEGYIFNLRSICQALQKKQLYISSRLCNRTTAVASDKTDKRMIELPKKLAAEYEYIEGRWAKVRP